MISRQFLTPSFRLDAIELRFDRLLVLAQDYSDFIEAVPPQVQINNLIFAFG